MKKTIAFFAKASVCCLMTAFAAAPASSSDFTQPPASFIQVEELFLSPQKPTENLWVAPANAYKAAHYGCPFYTDTECSIWSQKPTIMEAVALPARRIKTAGDYKIALIKRYNALMQSAMNCCTAGMESKMKQAGASKGLIYKFMVDDANFYGFGDRCLMMTDEELQAKYPQTATANAVSDIRDTCLCQRWDYFDALLAPFDEFAGGEITYVFQDGLQRDIQVSVMDDVRAVKEMLARCPQACN
jgi:hypothetical protein